MPLNLEEQLAHQAETARYIADRLPLPQAAVVLGSGLGAFAASVPEPQILDYQDIPYFPQPTVPGHSGRLLAGSVGGKFIYVFSGRFHYYEGHDPWTVILPMRVLKALGCPVVILTNAAGGINRDFHPGDLMLITDHINFTGFNPLRGPHSDAWGQRFPDMSKAYDRQLGLLAGQVALDQGFQLRQGVYCGLAGPNFETPAEIRMLRGWGADAVGMSTVPEALAAHQAGLRVLGISCISNMAAGVTEQELTHAEVFAAAQRVEARFSALLSGLIAKMQERP